MKILIYVDPKRDTVVVGEIDLEVTRQLEEAVYFYELEQTYQRFALRADYLTSPSVHRLACDEATEAAVLRALIRLTARVNCARDWANAVLSGQLWPTRFVPTYVRELWDKHPLALYRDLLGPDVTQAILKIANYTDNDVDAGDFLAATGN